MKSRFIPKSTQSVSVMACITGEVYRDRPAGPMRLLIATDQWLTPDYRTFVRACGELVRLKSDVELYHLPNAELVINENANEMHEATPAPIVRADARFEVVGDVVRDHETKLEWTRSNVVAERLNWYDAKAACEKLDLDGGGWRLPTIRELLSIVDYDRKTPAIDEAFTCESSWYWTSTPYAPVSWCAWLVDFYYGYSLAHGHRARGFVRAVRGDHPNRPDYVPR